MTPERKLALFEKYDFSGTGLLKRSTINGDDSKSALYQDIGGIIQALVIKLAEISHGTIQEVKEYNILQDDIYKGI